MTRRGAHDDVVVPSSVSSSSPSHRHSVHRPTSATFALPLPVDWGGGASAAVEPSPKLSTLAPKIKSKMDDMVYMSVNDDITTYKTTPPEEKTYTCSMKLFAVISWLYGNTPPLGNRSSKPMNMRTRSSISLRLFASCPQHYCFSPSPFFRSGLL